MNLKRNARLSRVSRRSEEGAAMLITMMILLMTTATALFAIHATSSEIRASGHTRQAMQTRYVGESGVTAALAWVDFYGADALRRTMTETSNANRAGGGEALNLAPFEPPLRADADAHRFYARDFLNLAALPVEREASLGARNAFETQLLVDVYDKHRVVRTIAGGQSQGGGRLEYLGATYTSRGRTRLATDYVTGIPTDRPFHEGASDARAFAVSGPIGRQ